VEAALRFAATEPHGDLAMSAQRAALIAVHMMVDLGWRPAEPAPQRRLTTGAMLVLAAVLSAIVWFLLAAALGWLS
jgi:hypothetical protein